jgi:anti-sigma regulatory factor (Ser/Thr protein kinase)/DNA-binding XRE family transcriptional regulator
MSPARSATDEISEQAPVGRSLVHAGHVHGSPAVPTGIPGLPQAPACCTGRHWLVVLDGGLLRQARRKAALSQERLAARSGISVTTIGNLERQARPRCHFRTRNLIAAALSTHPLAITAIVSRHPRSGPDGIPAESAGVAPCGQPRRPGWSLSSTFPAAADQVSQARRFLARMLGDCPVAEDTVLVCSELAANAVLHSASARPGGRFTVRAEVWESHYAWLEVEDQGGPWTARDNSAPGGRGLAIVTALASYWDIRGDDTARVVCARIDWPG